MNLLGGINPLKAAQGLALSLGLTMPLVGCGGKTEPTESGVPASVVPSKGSRFLSISNDLATCVDEEVGLPEGAVPRLTIFHVAMVHGGPFGSEKELQGTRYGKYLIGHQQQLADILGVVITEKKCTSIVGDGFSSENIEGVNKIVSIARAIRADPTLGKPQERAPIEDMVTYHGELRAARDHGVMLEGLESTELIRRMRSATSRDQQMRVATERTEHLFKAVQDRRGVVLFTLGGFHDFQPAVARWNREHPSDLIGLTVAWPRTLDCRREGLEKFLTGFND